MKFWIESIASLIQRSGRVSWARIFCFLKYLIEYIRCLYQMNQKGLSMCILYCITNQDRILSNGFDTCHDNKFISISYYKNNDSNQWV